MSQNDSTEISERLKALEEQIAKQQTQFSLKRIIPRAIINGIFASFGATIIFGLILFAASKIIDSSKRVEIIDNLIGQTRLEEIIENYERCP